MAEDIKISPVGAGAQSVNGAQAVGSAQIAAGGAQLTGKSAAAGSAQIAAAGKPAATGVLPVAAGSAQVAAVSKSAAGDPQVAVNNSASAKEVTNTAQSYKLDDPSISQPKTSFLEKLVQEKTGAHVTAPQSSAGAAVPTAAPKAPAAPQLSTNVFTKLFSAQKSAAPVSIGPAAPAASLSSLLGPKPTISQRVLMEEEVKIAKIAKTVLGICVLFTIGVYAFFYSRLDANFTLFSDNLGGPNIAQRFNQSNSELQKIKTNVNLENYRMLRLLLDDINRQIDAYNHQAFSVDSSFSTKVEREVAKQKMVEERGRIKDTLTKVQTILNQPINIDTYLPKSTEKVEREQFFTALLKDEINRQKTTFASEEQLRIYDNLTRLVDNQSFREVLRLADLATLTKDENRKSFDELLGRIRADSTDEFSAVNNIRVKRINWAQVIQSLHEVTRRVDDYYGKGFFKDAGGFLFNSYQFDSKTGRISISGITKTPTSKTFSIIANFVDAIEKSSKFRDIDFRSFAKSRDDNGDYSSSLNLDFSMQTGTDSRDTEVQVPQPTKS